MNLGLKAKRTLMAAFIAGAPLVSGAQDVTSEKRVVPLTEYFEIQKKAGHTTAHLNYTPFPNQMIEIPMISSTHGPITIHFNSHTITPSWNDKNNNGQIDAGEVNLRPTMAVISAVHSGLGSLNANDDPGVKQNMHILAKNTELVTPQALEKARGDDHLKDVHGIELFVVGGGRLGAGAQMLNIVSACKRELNLP
jgi:hypothetical protein